jgi:ParB family chromosome partitioning protein
MAKTGLGRGLGALLGGKKPADSPTTPSPSSPETTQPPSVESRSALEVEIGKIRPCPSQPRKVFDRQPLEELAESIKINGIIQPLVARQTDDGQLELIAGERRWRAAQIAELDTVPVIIRLANDAQVLELALVENLQREDLNPIEEAQGYALLIDAFNLTQEETAQRVGKSRTAITNSLRLLNLPVQTLDHLRAGRLTVGHAKVILGIEDANHQNLTAERAIKDSLSVRQTEELIADLLKDSSTSGKRKSRVNPNREVHVTSLENRLKEKLGTKVSLTYREGKGSLTIKYFSDEDLMRILKILDIES